MNSVAAARRQLVPTPVDVLELRAASRALLWATGEIECIAEAVDPLQAFAIESNLVADIGQDAVQRILSDAFDHAGRRAFATCHEANDRPQPLQSESVAPKRRPTPQTTIEAIMYCVRERGPQALHESANIERLGRCDEAAISEIDQRIAKLEATNAS
jgi:hypothetical protein